MTTPPDPSSRAGAEAMAKRIRDYHANVFGRKVRTKIVMRMDNKHRCYDVRTDLTVTATQKIKETILVKNI